MWGFKWLERDKNNHKKLLKLAADIVKYVEEDKARERLQAKINGEIPEAVVIKTKEEVIKDFRYIDLKLRTPAIWEEDFGEDDIVNGTYSDFWNNHIINNNTIELKDGRR